MYSKVERDPAYRGRLIDYISNEYDLEPTSLTPAARGYFGETWRLNAGGRSYFLKLDYSRHHGPIYANSFHVLKRMEKRGLEFVSKIISTRQGELYSIFDSAILGVFEWVDGENVENERTKFAEYNMLARVYTVPTDGLTIRREDFTPHSAELFFAQREKLKENTADDSAARLIALFDENRDKILHRAARLKIYSDRCRGDISGRFITHGDAGGNVIIDGDRFFLVDWDDPVLAPPERDAWFCLHLEWAVQAFNAALKKQGVSYELRPDRLAYYCYHSFFWYLTEHLATYFEIGDRGGDMATEIAGYFSCWIEDEIKFADSMQ